MPETMTFPRTRQGLRNLDEVPGRIVPFSGGPVSSPVNVGETERWASALIGGALALYGLTRGTFAGLGLALLGGPLLYRGLTGHCDLYQALGMNTACSRATSQEIVHRVP